MVTEVTSVNEVAPEEGCRSENTDDQGKCLREERELYFRNESKMGSSERLKKKE